MHRLRCAALLCSGSLALGTPATVAAQFPVGAAQMSPAAVSESLAVMRTLQDRARRTPDDAALQHRLGIVAFAIERRARLPGAPPGIVPWRIRTIAEGALQAALDLEPENTVHWLALGRFYQSQPGNAERLPRIYYDRGLALARAQRDTAMVATMAMELGTLHWRHAESNWRSGAVTSGELVVTMPEPATRAATRGSTETARAAIAQGELGNAAPGAAGIAIAYPVPNGVWGAAAGDTLQATPVLLATAIRRVSEALHPWPGPTAESFYLNAETYVREAHVLRPGDAAVFQRLAGVLALEDRWAALQGLAEGYLSRAPTDPWGWMSRGLAQHRLRQNRAARESFDSAMVRFSPEERARLDRIDRILSPREAASFVASDSARRANTARALWLLADPLWSQDEEDVRTEFLARLAYAELRFTWADGSVRGADTPAGQLYLRYGPPDEVRGDYWIYRSGVMLSACMRGAQRPVRTDGEWRWEAASTACEADVRLLNDVVAWQPSNWGNVALARIDTIPTQIARFRATPGFGRCAHRRRRTAPGDARGACHECHRAGGPVEVFVGLAGRAEADA